MFRLALAVIALRLVDDRFHLVGGLVPLALLALLAWRAPRMRPGARGTIAIVVGILGLATGVDAVYYTRELGLGAGDVTGWLALAAGAVLIGDGARTLFAARRTDRWRHPRRAALAVGGLVGAAVVLMPITIGYVETHVARAVVPADQLGVPHETVTFETADGLTLEGWYIPSRNGAAVIAFPGRKGPQRQARMLARHGYGVLLFDRRGEGRSEGDPNAWGWGGDEDIKAAVRYLKRRGDVDPARIGGIGLSVGGELMLEAAAEDTGLAAVVSEGAGARTMREEIDTDGLSGVDRLLGRVSYGLRDATVAISTGHTPPTHLKALVPRIAPRPLLLIADPKSPNGETLNRLYIQRAGEPKALWEIPGAGHVNGIATHATEYERRVAGFFDRSL
ncbi:alpha/beta hydrolase [Solirubrobacter soli]|uniref:alpha/beta hydrolase n=1 Tax=Solirubrobacter soli TaxID=363832 RepID=UPI000413A0D1|nr:alpha/beta fold hydrolase [Solirubrobacter soli]